jgi:hypothetical protein
MCKTEREIVHQGILKKWASVLITAAALLITGILLTGCGGSTYDTPREPAIPAATNMAGNVTAEEVCNELLDAGLTNVVIFNDWTADFAGSAGADAGLTDVWVSPEELRPDLVKCADGWEKHHDYSDANCRMTAFLLMDGIITSEKTDKAYDGTYLMFDVDAIENVPRYKVIKKNLALFTTLFGDRTPSE